MNRVDAESLILSYQSAIIPKFKSMASKTSRYWDLRNEIQEYEYEVGFNEFAYRWDKSQSGKEEAWEDFGQKWIILQHELDRLTEKYGSVEEAFLEKKRALLVDTDAILNSAFQILKEITGADNIEAITKDGRKINGFPAKYKDNEFDCEDIPYVPVKCLIWYGRNQANHYSDKPGFAVKKLDQFKEMFAENIAEHIHWQYANDLSIYFVPESKISMSDEIMRLLEWKSFEDFRDDLIAYV